MADYHIFLHSDTSSSSPTQVQKMGQNTIPKFLEDEEKINFGAGVQKVGSFLLNPDSIIGQAKASAMSNIAKAGVVGTIGLMAFQIGKKVLSEGISLYTTMTGDVTYQRALGNVQTFLGTILSPVNTIISTYTYSIQQRQQYERSILNQQMLGDSVINQNYNRKV